MYGVINEQEGSDPTNPDVYPDHDETGPDDAWSWYEWTVYYNALEKKYGEDFAKKRFLKYWEPVEAGSFVKADNDMDPQWFKDKEMWNLSKNRPYNFIEIETIIKNQPKKEEKPQLNPIGVSDKLVEFIKKEEYFVPCVYDDKKSIACLRKEWDKCCLRGRKSKGVPTIGYGTTFYPDGRKVRPSDPDIDETKATTYLKDHLNKLSPDVKKHFPKLNPHQHDAITSLCYNVGLAGCTTKAPNLYKELTKNPDPIKNPRIKSNLIDFANKNRRNKEYKIYSDADYGDA